MTYKTGIVNIDAAKNLVDLIRADAVALGFNHVEAGLVSGTITWDVLESPSTLNNEGLTWYLAIGYTTATKDAFWACTFEQWNATTNLASQYPPNTANLTPGAQFQNTQAAAALPSVGTTIFNRSATIAQNDNYWYSITPERLAVFATVGATQTNQMAWYIGLYDRFLAPSDDPFPLIFMVMTPVGLLTSMTVATTNSAGSASREPKTTTSNSNNFLAGVFTNAAGGVLVSPWTGGGLTTNATSPAAESYSGLPLVSRLTVLGRSLNSTVVTSHLRGLFKDMYYCPSPIAATIGTEIDFTFTGVTYTAVKIMSGNNFNSVFYVAKV